MASHSPVENFQEKPDSVEMTQLESKGIFQLGKIKAESQ